MRYYLGPLVQESIGPNFTYWAAPPGVVDMVHLASIPDHATGGFALMSTSDKVALGKDYRLIGSGDLRSLVPAERDRSVFASALGVRAVDGDTLVDWLWTAMTLYADPLGDTAVRPLMPTGRRLELRLAGHGLVMAKDFDIAMPEAAPVIDVLQKEYAALRADALDGKLTDAAGAPDAQKYLRVLDYWGAKYGVANPQDLFVPADLPKERPVKHATTITDSFDRADNASSLGSSSEGWSWSALENTMAIYSNKARHWTTAGSHAVARADSDLSSADHYVQGTARTDSTDITMAVLARKDSSATLTYYLFQLAMSLTQVRFYKRVGGTYTLLASPSFSSAVNTDYVLKASCNGSSITFDVDGVNKVSQTDGAITGNLRCGIGGYQNSGGSSSKIGTIDNWSGADIAAGGSTISAALTDAAAAVAAVGGAATAGAAAPGAAGATAAVSGAATTSAASAGAAGAASSLGGAAGALAQSAAAASAAATVAAVASANGALLSGATASSAHGALATAVAALLGAVVAGQGWAATAVAAATLSGAAAASEGVDGTVGARVVEAATSSGAIAGEMFVAAAQAAAVHISGASAGAIAAAVAAAVADLQAQGAAGAAFVAVVGGGSSDGAALTFDVRIYPALAGSVGLYPALAAEIELKPALDAPVLITPGKLQ